MKFHSFGHPFIIILRILIINPIENAQKMPK